MTPPTKAPDAEGAKCDLCDGADVLRLSARCHPTAPLMAERADGVITLRCYVPECGRFVASFRFAPPADRESDQDTEPPTKAPDDEVSAVVDRLRGEVEAEVPYPRPIGEIINILRRAAEAGRELGVSAAAGTEAAARAYAHGHEDGKAESAREERESCAHLAENDWNQFGLAQAIRARGDAPAQPDVCSECLSAMTLHGPPTVDDPGCPRAPAQPDRLRTVLQMWLDWSEADAEAHPLDELDHVAHLAKLSREALGQEDGE